MSTVKLHQLRYFLKVAEEGSISKASILLGIAQPAISQNILSLEHHFQAKLLNRGSRGVTLTHEGEMLIHHARTILRQVDRATAEIRNSNEGASGEVMVALPSASATVLAAPLIRKVAEQYPNIKLSLTESMSGQTSETISKGHADLALVPNGHLLPGVEAETVLTESLYFGGVETPELQGDGEIEFRDVCKYPLILPVKPNFVRGTLEQAAFDQGFELNIIAEQSSGRLLQNLLGEGLGYSVLTRTPFHANLANGGFFAKRVINPEFRRPLTIAWQKHGQLSDRVRYVRRAVREVVREAHESGIMRGKLEPEPARDR